jgi:hypothetical protein
MSAGGARASGSRGLRRALAAASAVALAAGLPPPARAAEGSPGLAEGPLPFSASVDALGPVRRAEPRSEVALGIGGGLILDEPGFYGMAQGALRVEGSWAVTPRWEVFAGLEALQFRYVQNATLGETSFTLGALTAGATWLALSEPEGRLDLAPFAALLLPTSLEYRNARVLGGEVGISLRGAATSWLAWYAGASLPVTGTASDAGNQVRAGAALAAGGSWTPARWFRVSVQLGAAFPFGDPMEQLAAGLGLRFAAGRLGIELDGILPFAGTSRFDAGALLRAAWRLD